MQKPFRLFHNKKKCSQLCFIPPLQAREGHYIDKKCPFTGNVSIRGRVLTGTIVKMKVSRDPS